MDYNSTKYKIIESAAACFSKNGFHKTTVDEIAAHAGVTKGSIYYNFDSKDDLLYNAIKLGIDIMNIMNEEILSKAHQMSDDKVFYEIIKTYATMSLDYPELSSLIFSANLDTLNKECADKIKELVDKLINDTASLLEQGAQEGLIKETDYKMAAFGIFGLVGNICNYYTKHLTEYNRNLVYTTLYEMIHDGIVVR